MLPTKARPQRAITADDYNNANTLNQVEPKSNPATLTDFLKQERQHKLGDLAPALLFGTISKMPPSGVWIDATKKNYESLCIMSETPSAQNAMALPAASN